MKKRVINLIIIVISLIIAFLIISPFALSPFEEPSNKFFKVDYKTGGKEKVILISWAGCPIGASLSWPLYFVLNQSGNASYYYWHSAPDDVYPDTPGLIFTNYTSRTINATFIYLYNETLKGSFHNGTFSGSLTSFGLEELKSDLPPAYYEMAKKYTTEEWISSGYFQTSSDRVSPHHINTIIIISGKSGTYVLNGDLYSPALLGGTSDSYLLKNGNNISYIKNAEDKINKYISEAA
ncbi:MAG: DUF929 domain-containing protein [Ferroplasma sp.]